MIKGNTNKPDEKDERSGRNPESVSPKSGLVLHRKRKAFVRRVGRKGGKRKPSKKQLCRWGGRVDDSKAQEYTQRD